MNRIRALGPSLSILIATTALAPTASAQQTDRLPPLPPPTPMPAANPAPQAVPVGWTTPRKLGQVAATTTTTTTTTTAPTGAPPPAQPAPPPPPAYQPPAATVPAVPAPPSPASTEAERARAAQSMKLTIESTQSTAAAADQPAEAPKPRSPDDSKLLHGFRIGYSHTFNYDKPLAQFNDGTRDVSLKEKVGLKAPDHLLLGYELIYRVVGQSWLNVLLVGNVNLAGLEQSKVLPTGNLLIGFEFNNSFQLGVGANLAPLKGSEAHAIVAAGWTPKVGTLYTPLHVFFIPDADGVHRIGATTGVTF